MLRAGPCPGRQDKSLTLGCTPGQPPAAKSSGKLRAALEETPRELDAQGSTPTSCADRR